MKTNHRWFLTVTIFAGLIARPALADKPPGTNTLGAVAAAPPAPIYAAPAAAPAVKTPAPAKKKTAAAKKTVKAKPVKKAVVPTGFSVPLKPGPATVAANRVNIRGQATTRSEVLGRLTNGEPVTVIEEITRENAKADEPSVWAKIVLPGDKHLWVSGQFVDAASKTVKVKKLNLRTGPGENYSVAGLLLKGDTVNEIGLTNGWLEIAAPANACAFVAAAYLKQEAAAPAIPAAPPVEVVPTTTNAVAEATPVAAPPTDGVSTAPLDTNAPATTVISTAPAVEEPPQPRIVEREGIVRRTFSIQAPSAFELVNAETGRKVNYLYTSSKELDLARYKGLHIIVTGEESLDERWLSTPVITIQKIQVIE